ncbi:hypothetical protein GCM10009742_67520 [Kribbella karoonensis]|uniref:Uncharacterized protein n=1 Tax=Kribbella karoonensis TaxID=324851 RepID=A0ABN2EKT1_9ACTN
MFVAADRLTGVPVQVGQAVQPAAAQYGVHGRGRQAEGVRELHRAEAVPAAQADDPAYDARRGLVRLLVRA